jgi:Tol biopolymer transport system component
MGRLGRVFLAVGSVAVLLTVSSLAAASGGGQSTVKQRIDTRIVFENNHLCDGNDCGNGEIAVVNLNGSGFRRLTHNFVTDESPAWSPAKRRIAFMRYRAGGFGILVMDANGHHQRVLPGPKYANQPDWSPDGRRIVFQGGTDQMGFGGLWTVNVKTGRLTRLLSGKTSFDAPAWSPDGTRIAFGSNSGGSEQIWTLRLRDHRLTSSVRLRQTATRRPGRRMAAGSRSGAGDSSGC